MSDKITASDVRVFLRDRYKTPEWSLFFEVGDGTGVNQKRWADAVAMNVWPSKGLVIHGFEIKVSKQDFLKELEDPGKSEAVKKYCDYWWVCAPAHAVDPALLPVDWGWMNVTQKRMAIRRDAPKLTPVDLDRSFAASLLRNGARLGEVELNKIVSKRVDKELDLMEKELKRSFDLSHRRNERAKEQLDEIFKWVGERPGAYVDDEALGKAVKLVMELGIGRTYGMVEGLKRDTSKMIKLIEELEQVMEKEAA